MSRKLRMIKRIIRKGILYIITGTAFLMFIASTGALVEQYPESMISFVLSIAWLVAFGQANDWLDE